MDLGLKRWSVYTLLALIAFVQGCKDDSGSNGECPWVIAPFCVVGAVVATAAQGQANSSARPLTGDIETPATPSHLRSEYMVSNGEMTISWQQASDNSLIYDYRIYRDGLHLQNTPGPGFVDLDLDPNRTYCYQVSERDYRGNESQKSIESCSSTAHSSLVARLPPSGINPIHPTSLALDLAGHAHMSFFVAESRDIYHATNAFGEWLLTRIDTDAGGAPSLSLDSQANVHLVYQTVDSFHLKYATNASGKWRVTTIDSTRAGGNPSVGIDSTGMVHASYYGHVNQSLKYASNRSGRWEVQTVDQGYDTGRHSSIAVDAMDGIHISYWDKSNGALKYASNTNGSWSLNTVESMGTSNGFSALAIDSFGMIHISYYDETISGLKYVTNETGEWIKGTIDDSDSTGWNPTIAIDFKGYAHVSYHGPEHDNLRYATNASGEWKRHNVATYSSGGSSIKLDSVDKAHISFQDQNNIKYLIYSIN